MYELVIIWSTGEKEVCRYDTESRAMEAGEGMQMAFGAQVSWWCVRRNMEGWK